VTLRTSDDTLSIPCPQCGACTATLIVRSYSVATVCCAACDHPWSVEIAALSQMPRERLGQALCREVRG